MDQHHQFMSQAYQLALKGWGKTLPNPMVGAVLVKNGKVIAEGWHPYCGGPHAERMAITKAGAKAKGADLYVTLEPCRHHGRTPPCTDAIIKAGIKNVFVGVTDPNPLMRGKSLTQLKKAGIRVQVGFLNKELIQLNEAFNHYIEHRCPFVTAKSAQTLDGKIALPDGKSKWITSSAARQWAKRQRFGFDAICVGVDTVLKDDPRLNTIPRKRIKKVVLDVGLRTPPSSAIFNNTRPEDVIIFTAAKPSAALNKKATIIQAPLIKGKISWEFILAILGERGVASLLIEGGGKTIVGALKERVVNKLMVYVAPVVMGEGISAFGNYQSQDMGHLLRLKGITIVAIGPDFLIEAYPVYRS